jgi:hypothetical protein
VVVQFQDKEDVQLHYNGKPGNKCALRMTPTKKRPCFETRIVHSTKMPSPQPRDYRLRAIPSHSGKAQPVSARECDPLPNPFPLAPGN